MKLLNFKNILLPAALTAFLLVAGAVLLGPAPSYASPATSEACDAIGGCNQDSGVQDVINVFVNIFTVVVGLVAVIMIIFGGFKYVTAAGDSGKLSSARNTIIYAIVGLVIVALAQLIVSFVLTQAG